MNDPSRYTESKAETTRRWVKVIGIIVLIVVVLVVVMLLAGGGHRPRPHSLAAGHPGSSTAEAFQTRSGSDARGYLSLPSSTAGGF